MSERLASLNVDRLRRICDPDQLEFDSTEGLSPMTEIIGQQRAVRSVTFGINIDSPGYHIYALGRPGTGKTTTIRRFLESKAESQPVPDDWCYVNNFDEPDTPRALRLPAGVGCKFRDDMDRMVEDLQTDIPAAFEGEEYEREQEQIQESFQERRRELFAELEQQAEAKGFTLMQTPRGLILAPIIDGEVVTPDKFNQLDEETRSQMEERQEALQEKLRETGRQVQNLQQEYKEEIRQLDRQVVGYTVEHQINALKEKYADHPAVREFLDQVRADLLDNVEAFKQARQREQVQAQLPFQIGQASSGEPRFDKYRANLIVDHCDTEGAPVLLEGNPTQPNLVGRVEHQARLGALVTDFNMVKAGALHQANGGYLMLEMREILTKPFAWEALKRALKRGDIRIESLREALGAISTRTLEPQPIPLDVKVVLIGDPLLYYLLYSLDPDFQELFKVKADFAERMDWESETVDQYARFIGTVCQEEGLRHFAPSGVARVVEHGARLVADQRKVATRFGDIVDLLREASYWAGENDREVVRAADVKQAIDEQIYRSNRLEQRLQEMIAEGTILIDTSGETVGQVNGISVLPLGDYAFGKPSRLTARTHVGSAGVVNIERESELGGRIHNKGVMILSGYLGGKFAQDTPLALSASLTFEQLYDEVEGDSASSAELYALLSSLSGYPIKQSLAVTGSVNQRGQVQAIGGVNEKIEGFFHVCRQIGLTGDQGVVIPRSNVKNLMLQEEILEAVEDGDFHIYSVKTVEEGIELLTGVPAGERGPDGTYPEGTVFRAVQDSLLELAEKVRAYHRFDRQTAQDGRGELETA